MLSSLVAIEPKDAVGLLMFYLKGRSKGERGRGDRGHLKEASKAAVSS